MRVYAIKYRLFFCTVVFVNVTAYITTLQRYQSTSSLYGDVETQVVIENVSISLCKNNW